MVQFGLTSRKSTKLKGQNKATLTVGKSLAGHKVRVRVTGRATGYNNRSVYSARTARVARA